MPIVPVPNTELTYHLICFSASGEERTDDPDGQMSQGVLEALKAEPITDVFLMSHGWLGDVVDAKNQYHKWVGTMAGNTTDIQRMRQARPRFRPLLIGLHWPSKPYGDEELGGSATSFAGPLAGGGLPVDEMVDEYARRLANTPAAPRPCKRSLPRRSRTSHRASCRPW